MNHTSSNHKTKDIYFKSYKYEWLRFVKNINCFGQHIRKDLEVNELDPNKVFDRTLWRHLIHVADPT